MKIKLDIKRQVQLPPDILEEKINNYLKNKHYRTVDKGLGYFIFIDDEYSDRKRSRSDYHTRIGEGKFEFQAVEQGTMVKLIYLTDITFPIFFMTLFAAGGAYVKSITPILMSFFFTLPVIFKIVYLNDHVFNEILE